MHGRRFRGRSLFASPIMTALTVVPSPVSHPRRLRRNGRRSCIWARSVCFWPSSPGTTDWRSGRSRASARSITQPVLSIAWAALPLHETLTGQLFSAEPWSSVALAANAPLIAPIITVVVRRFPRTPRR